MYGEEGDTSTWREMWALGWALNRTPALSSICTVPGFICTAGPERLRTLST